MTIYMLNSETQDAQVTEKWIERMLFSWQRIYESNHGQI